MSSAQQTSPACAGEVFPCHRQARSPCPPLRHQSQTDGCRDSDGGGEEDGASTEVHAAAQSGERWRRCTAIADCLGRADDRAARNAALADAIRNGRRAELEPLGWEADSLADPLDPAVAEEATLDWLEPLLSPRREVLDWYRTLIRLRRAEPELATGPAVAVDVDEERRTLVMRRGPYAVAVNLGTTEVSLALDAAEVLAATGEVIALDGLVELGPHAAAVVR